MTQVAKARVPVPDELAADVLYLANRTCCVCNEPGRVVQIHHIDGDPANNTIANLAVLCLECHDRTQLSGGFGRQLDAAQVVRYRDAWFERVRDRREQADRLAAAAGTVVVPEPVASVGPPPLPPREGLITFLNSLPPLRRLAYTAAAPGETTAGMMEASYLTIQVLETALLGLARFYPYGHFGGEDPRSYFGELISSRFRWHRYHHSTEGEGFSGTIVGPLASGDVIADVERMIEDMATSLSLGFPEREFNCDEWRRQWHGLDEERSRAADHPGKTYVEDPNDLDGPARE